MNNDVLFLSGAELSLSDLVRIGRGCSLKVDTDLVKSLATGSQELLDYTTDQSRVHSSLALNSILKSPSETSLEAVESILSSLSSSQVVIKLSAQDRRHFSQDTYKILSDLVLSVQNLFTLVPLLDGLIAFTIESENSSSAIADEELFPLSTHGLKTTINNLQSLLAESQLARKNSPSDTIIELVQISGFLKDILEDSVKTIEKEANVSLTALKKTDVKRSSFNLIKLVSELFNIASNLSFILGLDFDVSFSSNYRNYPDIVAPLQGFQSSTLNLLESVYIALQEHFNKLAEFEKKLNENAKKYRPIQLGKGNRSLFQHIKEAAPSVLDLSRYLSGLLESKNDERRVPKIAKGMRDYSGEEMKIREYVFSVIRSVFKKHMADELDTPVMELRETLTGKYGEEGSKLIYNLADQGGELLSLRYDLTVPFARYVAINRITNWKRFQIGKVYRRDQPQMKRGRYREFYQCDFDIVGGGSVMSQDAEVLKIVIEILRKLEFNFLVKINHRKLLDAFLEISGCPSNKFRTVSSSIDKLDKEEWSKVRNELINEKEINEQAVDIIGEYVKINGNPRVVLGRLSEMEVLQNHPVAKKTLEELSSLINFCECLDILENLSLDLSLARGLDYYTGLVYEAVVTDGQVGSIAGGGRYDELIMKLNNSNQPVPAVGVSLGVERLFTIIEERVKASKSQENSSRSLETLLKSNLNTVLVAQAGTSKTFNLMQERYKICNLLWNKGINADTSYKEKSDPKGQAGYASQNGIRWIIWVGESELLENKVKIKDLNTHSEENIPIEGILDYILTH